MWCQKVKISPAPNDMFTKSEFKLSLIDSLTRSHIITSIFQHTFPVPMAAIYGYINIVYWLDLSVGGMKRKKLRRQWKSTPHIRKRWNEKAQKRCSKYSKAAPTITLQFPASTQNRLCYNYAALPSSATITQHSFMQLVLQTFQQMFVHPGVVATVDWLSNMQCQMEKISKEAQAQFVSATYYADEV